MNAALQQVLEAALASLEEDGALPQEASSVTDWAVLVLVRAIDVYMDGTSPLAQALDGLASALHVKDDPTVAAIGISERQLLWSVLGSLRIEKLRRQKAHGKGNSESEDGQRSEGA